MGKEREGAILLLLRRIPEPVTRVEDTEIVHVLHVSLAEVEAHVEPLRQEVQRVERLGLRLADGRDVLGPRQRLEAREAAAGVLDQDALGGGGRRGLVEEERAVVVGGLGVAKSAN